MSPVSNILSSEPCVAATRSSMTATSDLLFKNFPDSTYDFTGLPETPPGSLNDTLESQSLASSVTTNGTNSSVPPSVTCKWFGCCKEIVCNSGVQSFDSGVSISNQIDATSPEEERDLLLLDHLITQHVLTQSSKRRKYFTCHWTDCKVYRKASLSYKWLENHILCHLENAKARRPFQCLFECPKRFSSRLQLERHINAIHLQGTSPPLTVTKTTLNDISEPKLVPPANKSSILSRHNKKKRLKKFRGFKVRSVDFYDPRTQAHVTNELILNAIQYEPVIFSLSSTPNSTPAVSPKKFPKSSPSISALNSFKKALPDGPSFSTRSMSRQSSLETLPCTQDEINLSSPQSWKHLSASIKRLLTMPYAILGRRNLSNRPTEVLVKWFSKNTSLPNEWIEETDFAMATNLGYTRSKRTLCKAPLGFRLKTPAKPEKRQQNNESFSSCLNFTI